MNQYMVDIDLPEDVTEEFVALIPEQRAQINDLMASGTVISYTLSLDRTKVWAIINANNTAEVQEILEAMPMVDFMASTIYELAFHNVAGSGLPAISLN